MGVIDLDYLLDFADRMGARIYYSDLRSLHPELLGYTKPPCIYLDVSLRDKSRQHKCILAEELGHILYPPRPGHVAFHRKSYINLDHCKRGNIKAIVAQDERKALDWATSILMPDVEFWRVIEDGINTVHELAEYFDVEHWFVLHKIGYIRRKAGYSGQALKYRDII